VSQNLIMTAWTIVGLDLYVRNYDK